MAPNPPSSSGKPANAPMELPQAVIAQAAAAAAETQRDDEGPQSQADSETSKGKETKSKSAPVNKHMCVCSDTAVGVCFVPVAVKLIVALRSQRYTSSSNHQNPNL